MKMLLKKGGLWVVSTPHSPNTCFKTGRDQQSAVKLVYDKSNLLFFGKVSKKCFGEAGSRVLKCKLSW